MRSPLGDSFEAGIRERDISETGPSESAATAAPEKSEQRNAGMRIVAILLLGLSNSSRLLERQSSGFLRALNLAVEIGLARDHSERSLRRLR